MRATSAIGRQFEVLFFLLCGLSFWALVLALLWVLGGALLGGSLQAHALPADAERVAASEPRQLHPCPALAERSASGCKPPAPAR